MWRHRTTKVTYTRIRALGIQDVEYYIHHISSKLLAFTSLSLKRPATHHRWVDRRHEKISALSGDRTTTLQGSLDLQSNTTDLATRASDNKQDAAEIYQQNLYHMKYIYSFKSTHVSRAKHLGCVIVFERQDIGDLCTIDCIRLRKIKQGK